MTISFDELRQRYPHRIENLKTIVRGLKSEFPKAIDEWYVLDFGYTTKFSIGADEVSIDFNIPHIVLLTFKEYEYGSDYIKTDKEWIELVSDVIEVARKLSAGDYAEFAYIHKNKQIAGYLEITMNNKKVKIENLRRPYFPIRLKKIQIK